MFKVALVNSLCQWLTLRLYFRFTLKTGFLPVFEQKIQGLFKGTFPIFQGLYLLQKSLNSMSFLVLPQHR